MPNINKVVFGNQTLIDLSTTTLSQASQLANGVTAYDRAGNVITGTASGGGSKNVQVAQSTTRVASTTYTKAASLICTTTGTYDVYWDCFRSTSAGTSGSQLHIGDATYGSVNIVFSNQTQNNHLTGVPISANQEVSVYVRSRAAGYYAYCGQLTIVQTA